MASSDPKPTQRDEELKGSDESDEELMEVYDQLHPLSDPLKPSPQTLDELVWVEGSDFVPQVKEEAAMQTITSDLLDPLSKDIDEKPKERSKDIDEKPKEVLDEVSSPTNLRFSITLKKYYFYPHYVAFLPAKIVKELPRNKRVPVLLTSYGKMWKLFYNGHQKMKTLDCGGWKKFVVDSKLEVGDVCLFEALENSPEEIVFEVVITRAGSRVEAVNGTSAEEPIVID